jgi:hypothetical protein
MERAGVILERGEAVSAVKVNFKLGMQYSEQESLYPAQRAGVENRGEAGRRTAITCIYAVSR